jgi:hypothetical protein
MAVVARYSRRVDKKKPPFKTEWWLYQLNADLEFI